MSMTASDELNLQDIDWMNAADYFEFEILAAKALARRMKAKHGQGFVTFETFRNELANANTLRGCLRTREGRK